MVLFCDGIESMKVNTETKFSSLLANEKDRGNSWGRAMNVTSLKIDSKMLRKSIMFCWTYQQTHILSEMTCYDLSAWNQTLKSDK